MFIEAICKYRIKSHVGSPSVVSCLYTAPLDAPNYEDEYLLVEKGVVQVFDGIRDCHLTKFVIKYKEDEKKGESKPWKGFRLEHIDNNMQTSNLGDDQILIENNKYKITEFACLYRTASVVFKDGEFTGKIEMGDKTICSILGVLTDLNGELEQIDGVYGKSESQPGENKVENEKNKIGSFYLIHASDGTIKIDSQLLEAKEDLGDLNSNFSERCSLGVCKSEENSTLLFEENSTLRFEENSTLRLDDNSTLRLDESSPDNYTLLEASQDNIQPDVKNSCENEQRSAEEVSTNEDACFLDRVLCDGLSNSNNILYEHSNKVDYIFLIRKFIKDIRPKGHSFIIHFYLCNQFPLYFTVFSIQKDDGFVELSVFLAKKLFNLVLLFNYIHSHEDSVQKFLGISCFSNGQFFLAHKNQDLVVKYKLQHYRIQKLVDAIFLNHNVMIEHTPHTFWIIMFLLESMFPLKWPGLIISPINPEMLYLLDGPYRFVISIGADLTVGVDRVGSGVYFSSDELKIQNGKMAPNSYRIDAQNYAEYLLLQKLDNTFAFPLKFTCENHEHIGYAHLHEASEESVDYVYDLDEGLVFLPRAYLYNENPLRLWALFFPGELDYDALLEADKELLPYLAKRACMDKDQDSLLKIVSKLKLCDHDIMVQTLQNICNYDNVVKRLLYDLNVCNIKVINVCECNKARIKKQHLHSKDLFCDKKSNIRHFINDKTEPRVPKISLKEFVCKTQACKKYTLLFLNDFYYDLLCVNNLLALMDLGYMNEQIYCSIVAYIYFNDLPFTENGLKCASKYFFIVDS